MISIREKMEALKNICSKFASRWQVIEQFNPGEQERGILRAGARLLFLFFIFQASTSQALNNGQAAPKAIVRSGQARFTVLGPGIIRLEYDSAGTFNDAPSFIVINRKLPVPAYQSKTENGWLTITTAKLTLHYQLNSGAFTADNLTITYKGKINWKPGDKQQQNLKGTARTLDTYDGDVSYENGQKLQLQNGLLARDGWTLLDDSRSLLFDNSPWPWVKTRNHAETDWYFFGYGTDYKQALYDYTLIAGKVPLPPRFAFGWWWSRYYKYSENDLRDLLGHIKQNGLPLDVLVIDMDWHRTDSLYKTDADGESKGWNGYAWDKGLFTDPDAFLAYLKTQQLKVTLNLHPASGIAPFDPQYGAFAKQMHFDTATHRNIPYVGSDKKFMQNLFGLVLDPIKKQGVNFWWLDWQQWPNDKLILELDNTWWINYAFFSHMQRTSNERPLIYHRWGGLGNHRYQIGFSGDAVISWKSLAFQPEFTNTASNVLYDYWSHDIGGHTFATGQKHELDPELYTRWTQYGVFSPIFRTHSAKYAALNKEPWNFKAPYEDALMAAIKRRYELAPYIYTMARKTYDTGIGLCRPLYYDYPGADEAYDNKSEYLFGDDLLIAPVGEAMAGGVSKKTVWLPPGNNWYEWDTGTLLKGGQTLTRNFGLAEYPVYVKAGAIIPLYDNIKNLQQNPNKMALGIFPGKSGQCSIYEDKANDQNYGTQFTTTKVSSEVRYRTTTVTIQPRKGSYPGMAQHKAWQLRFYGAEMPQAVSVNGKPGKFYYNGAELCALVDIPATACEQTLKVKVSYSSTEKTDLNKGLLERMKKLREALKTIKAANPNIVIPMALGTAEELNRAMEYHPEQFYQLIKGFEASEAQLPALVRQMNLRPEVQQQFLNLLQ